MKKEKLNEFLDTKKSKIVLADISAEAAEVFIDSMLYAEKYAENQVVESRAYLENSGVEEPDPEDPTENEIDLLIKSLNSRELKAFLENI